MKKIENFLYKFAVNQVKNKIIRSHSTLTADYLICKGWITEYDEISGKTFYVEPDIKDRDKVSLEFENHYYRVWHGRDRTFIALESSIEWLELYLLLIDKHKK